MRPTGFTKYTCSGKNSITTPGDVIHVLDEWEYRKLRSFIHSGVVVFRRIDANANQRSFMRYSAAFCLLPTPTGDAEIFVDETTDNCPCKIPLYVTYKHPEFDSVTKIQERFEETKTAAHAAFH